MALIFVCGLALPREHAHASENYRGIGINDCKIAQRLETYMLIEQSVDAHECDRDSTTPTIQLLAVKAYSMNMIRNNAGSVTFCHYQ